MAWEAAISVLVGLALGYYGDQWLGTGPILFILFTAAGLYSGYKRVQAMINYSANPPDSGADSPDAEDSEER